MKDLDFKSEGADVGLPILLIIIAEVLIYFGMRKEALWIHLTILIGLSFSTIFTEKEEFCKTYQALTLLPILRLVSLLMPVFFNTTLYSFFLIYIPIAISSAITAVHQRLTCEEAGITLRKIWLYFPLAVLISFVLALIEYRITITNYLIPDLSSLSLVKLTIVMVFFVGLVEEFIFRSVLQTRFNRIFGAGTAILLSGALFGLMHSGYGLSYEIIYTFFIGIFMGYLFYKTKSLPLIVLIHGFLNVFLFGLSPIWAPDLGYCEMV